MKVNKIDDVIIKVRDEYERPATIVVKGEDVEIEIQQESISVNAGLRSFESTIGRSSMVNISIHSPFTIEIIEEEVCSFDDVESLL